VLASIAALALAGHLAAHVFFGVLLPLGRTGLFLAPLGALAPAPIVEAAPGLSGERAWPRLALAALYFLGCLRLTYFKEWRYGADDEDHLRRAGLKPRLRVAARHARGTGTPQA